MIKHENELEGNVVCVPLARYTELLRKEWTYDILKTKAEKSQYTSLEERILYGIKEEKSYEQFI